MLDRESAIARQPFDKILFAIGSIYLFLVIVWLVSHNRFPLFSNPQPQPLNPAISTADQAFSAYLQKSLENIDQKGLSSASIGKSSLPSVSVPLATASPPPPPIGSNSPTVIERVYIPLYPQTPPVSSTVNAPSPSSPPQATVTLPPPPPPQYPLPSANDSLSSVPVLTPGSALIGTAPSPTTVSSGYRLVGVLEAGDRSKAIFKNEQTSRQYQIGEGVGTTGWIVRSIDSRTVTISRQGKQRVLAIGQNFN